MQQDEGRYVCRATNELGEDQTEANLVCRPLPHLQSVMREKIFDPITRVFAP